MLGYILSQLTTIPAAFVAAITFIAVWDLVWKGMALWKCGRNAQLVWFICILILNTAGILPIVYLIFFQRKRRRR